MAKNNKNWLDKYSPNKNSSKKPKRYPAGGFLDYQNSYQGFGNGPQLYQDNSYFRTIIPGSSEDINSLINKPTFMSDINTGLGYANKALDIAGSLQSQFPKKQGGEGFTGKIDPNQGGGPEIMDNSLKSFQGLGEEIKLNNLGSHFNFEQKIPNFAGGGLAEMYGNSYGNMSNVNSPIKFNSSTGRAKAGDFMDTVGNDWLHTKMNDNRLRKEDDKIDWGVANFLKEPVSFGAGLIAASPIGTMTGLDKIYNDSFMSRTVGGKLGGGTMKTTMGAGQVVGGVLSGNAGMVTAGVGDLGEGIVGTAGSISADANIGGSYDKNAYLSNKKIEKGATEFNQAAHSLSSFMGGIDGFSGGASGVFGTKGGDLSSIGKGMGPKMQNFGKVSEQLYNNNFFGRPQGTKPVGTFPGGGYVNYSIIDRIMHDLESSKKRFIGR